jgi:endonuclease/exonuclease/phosphatase family metal-dependent hydrolase
VERPRPGRRIPAESAFHSRASCEAQLRARPARGARGPRIGSWNLRWFPDGAAKPQSDKASDLAWMACAIASMDVDVLAVQEVLQTPAGRAALLDLQTALDTLTGGDWHARLDDCSAGRFQHVGFLYDGARVELRAAQVVAQLNPGGSACAHNLRPGFAAYARFKSGPDVQLVTVHFDSGVVARDFDHRQASYGALERVVPELLLAQRDRDLLLLGDLNTMGCAECALPQAAAQELAALDEQLARLELVRLELPEAQACTEYHGGQAGALDHVIAARAMRELAAGAKVEVFGPCRDLGCERPARGEQVAAWHALSDHCPVVIELQPRDLD